MQALSVICAYKSLERVADAAIHRQGYGETDHGLGLEYPTRADRADQVRIWYWEYRTRKGPHPTCRFPYKIVTRKYHIPERLYLSVLASLLAAQGLHTESQAIQALRPLDSIDIRYTPLIYGPLQYKIEPFSSEAQHCLMVILGLHNLALTTRYANARQGFDWFEQSTLPAVPIAPTFFQRRSIQYSEDGTLTLRFYDWHQEPQVLVLNEALYRHVLEQVLLLHG
jgi:hypothetical protein